MRGLLSMRGLLRDFRYHVVVLTRNPGATATVVLSLALAIGVNTTFFSYINAILVRPVRLGDADRLAAVITRNDSDRQNSHSSYPDFRDLRDRHPLFDGVAANFYTSAGIKTDDGPEVVLAQLASGSYFDVMGVPPILGRGFRPEEDAPPDVQRVAVISHRLWTRRFGAARDVVGKALLINNQPFTIIGVAAEGFVGPRSLFATDVWVPLSLAPRLLPFRISLENRGATWLIVTGRMRPGVTLAQAEAAAESLATALAEQNPDTNRGRHFRLFPVTAMRTGLKDPLPPTATAATVLVLALVAVVLLIACLNVAGIQVARAWDRRREIALRLSLGASRGRIARQMFAETLLLALAGGVVGLLFASWTVDLLLRLQPAIPEMPITIIVPFDWRVLVYTAGLSVASAVAAGVVPAMFGLRGNLSGALRDNGWTDRPRSRARLRQGLVVAQVALSAVLLVGSGLAIQSMRNASRIDPGFDLSRTVIVPLDLGYGLYDEASGRRFFQEARERVARLPAVSSAAFALDIPLGQMHYRTWISVEGYTPAPDENMSLRFNIVGSGYFDTLRVPIVRGRAIDGRDTRDSLPAAVVSEAFVSKYLGGGDAIGRRFSAQGRSWSVVGVMRDGRYDRLDEPVQPYFCVPDSQSEFVARLMLLVAATGAEPSAVARTVSGELSRMDPGLPLGRVLTGREFLYEPLHDTGGPDQFVWGPGLLALVLALIGVYGLVAYSVSQRTRELGVRVALGARPAEVARLVFRQALALMLAGSGIGLVIALVVGRAAAGILYQIRPFEPLVFAAVLPLLVLCGLLASWGPARRAIRTDPIRALRCE